MKRTESIRDTLLEQRKFFDKKLEESMQAEDPGERFNKGLELLRTEEYAEFAYRSGLIRGKISGLGLEDQMTDIIGGMNRTVNRVMVSDIPKFYDVKKFQKIIRANNDSVQKFALDYIDKWVMYNNLFREEKYS